MSDSGLFIKTYDITSGMLGAPSFQILLTVNTPMKSVNGTGRISNGSIHPPMEIGTNLHGDFTYLTVMPNNSNILVVAEGYPIIKWPAHGGIGPVLMPNVHLRMVLNEDWSEGTASYSYLYEGEWHEVNNVPVHSGILVK